MHRIDSKNVEVSAKMFSMVVGTTSLLTYLGTPICSPSWGLGDSCKVDGQKVMKEYGQPNYNEFIGT